MRYCLRSLLIVLAIGPPVLAGVYFLCALPASNESLVGGPLTLAALLLVLGTLVTDNG